MPNNKKDVPINKKDVPKEEEKEEDKKLDENYLGDMDLEIKLNDNLNFTIDFS